MTSGSGWGCCTRCGVPLRRTRRRGQAWCDPCQRTGPDPRRDLPAGFHFQVRHEAPHCIPG
ncbi:MAG: hypothetical protein ACRDRI_14500 [Pseudonocardiaceae bacterium]